MASLKDLRSRIKSVKNTQQITKTMKMVAAAKVRKARTRCEASRPFAERLNGVLVNLASGVSEGGPLLLAGRAEIKTTRLVVFGSDRGLCGAFNGNLMKEVAVVIDELQKEGKRVQVVAVGRKVRDAMKALHPTLLVDEVTDYSRDIDFEMAENIGNKQVKAFENAECDQVIMVFNSFVSMLKQEPTRLQLLPFSAEAAEEHAEGVSANTSFEYEPNDEVILADLLPRNVRTQVFRALLETNAGEQAARMTAMENATRNAGDMIKKLSLEYNRSRQAAITNELIEIISGAEAL